MKAPVEAPLKLNDSTTTVTSPHWLQWFQRLFDRLTRYDSHLAETNSNPHGTDHDMLDGLGDDDHTQYLLLAGRAGQRAAGPLAIGGVTDHTLFEADGTRQAIGAATTYRDIDFPVIVKTIGVGVPALNTLQGNLQMLQWLVNDAQQIEVKEQIHLWKEASTGYWHCHIITGGMDATDRYLRFEIEWTWANFGSVIAPNTVVTSPDMLIPANTPALTHLAFDIGQAAFADGRIAAHIKARAKRVAAVGTAPTANPFCEMFQMHVECDTDGSRQQWTK